MKLADHDRQNSFIVGARFSFPVRASHGRYADHAPLWPLPAHHMAAEEFAVEVCTREAAAPSGAAWFSVQGKVK
jgi:hypothetical protein